MVLKVTEICRLENWTWRVSPHLLPLNEMTDGWDLVSGKQLALQNWCYCHSFSIHASSELFLSFLVSPHYLPVKYLGLWWETRSCNYYMYMKHVFLMCVNIVVSTCLGKASKLKLCWWSAFAGLVIPTVFIWISCKEKHESHAKSFPYIQGVAQDSSRNTQRLLDLLISFSCMSLYLFYFVYSDLCSCTVGLFSVVRHRGEGHGVLKRKICGWIKRYQAILRASCLCRRSSPITNWKWGLTG